MFLPHTPMHNVDYHEDANTPGKGGSRQRLTCIDHRPLDCVMQSPPDGFNSFRSSHCRNRRLGSVVAIFAPILPKGFFALGIMSPIGGSALLAGTYTAATGLHQRGQDGAINHLGAALGSSRCARSGIRIRIGWTLVVQAGYELEWSFARG